MSATQYFDCLLNTGFEKKKSLIVNEYWSPLIDSLPIILRRDITAIKLKHIKLNWIFYDFMVIHNDLEPE